MNWDGEKYEELEYDLLNEDAETEVAAEVAEAAVNMALALVVDAVLSPLARSGADNLAPSTFLLEEALTWTKEIEKKTYTSTGVGRGMSPKTPSTFRIYWLRSSLLSITFPAWFLILAVRTPLTY